MARPEEQVTPCLSSAPCLIFHREKKRKIGHEGTILTGRKGKGKLEKKWKHKIVCKNPRTD